MNKQLNDVTSHALVECLKMTTGLPVRRALNGAEIELDGYWCSCQTNFDSFVETEDGIMSAAFVRVMLNKDTIIEDLIVGMGQSVTDSALSAIQQFVSGMVVPVAAISSKLSPEHCGHNESAAISKMTYRGLDWNVSLSQVVSNDATGQLYEVVDQDPPINILWNALERKMETPRSHWATLYLCRYPDGEVDGDVRIDNETDEQALQTLLSFVWPTEQELIWFRQFCFLEPIGFRRNNSPARSKNPLKWFTNHPFC